ncbi:MAG: crossover junction endodeoxyribonuclease RuvC, partial [Christensenellales bacterium]
MRILGIDPGIGTMGYGVIDYDRGSYFTVDYGVVKTNKDDVLPKRLLDLENALISLIEKFKPDRIAVEELFFTKNITTGIVVAEARGVILLTCAKMVGDNIYEYTPNQIKQA